MNSRETMTIETRMLTIPTREGTDEGGFRTFRNPMRTVSILAFAQQQNGAPFYAA